MAQRKPYNPNTKYGRRKLREEAQKRLSELPPEDRREMEMIQFIILLAIALGVLGCGFLCGNEKAALKWLTR